MLAGPCANIVSSPVRETSRDGEMPPLCTGKGQCGNQGESCCREDVRWRMSACLADARLTGYADSRIVEDTKSMSECVKKVSVCVIGVRVVRSRDTVVRKTRLPDRLQRTGPGRGPSPHSRRIASTRPRSSDESDWNGSAIQSSQISQSDKAHLMPWIEAVAPCPTL